MSRGRWRDWCMRTSFSGPVCCNESVGPGSHKYRLYTPARAVQISHACSRKLALLSITNPRERRKLVNWVAINVFAHGALPPVVCLCVSAGGSVILSPGYHSSCCAGTRSRGNRRPRQQPCIALHMHTCPLSGASVCTRTSTRRRRFTGAPGRGDC